MQTLTGGEGGEGNQKMQSTAENGGLAPAVKVDFSEDDPGEICSVTPSQTEQRGGNPSPLMEIYSIRLLLDEDCVLPHIYGAIAVEGSSGTSILCNRKVGDPRLVTPEGLVKLSGMRQGLKVEGDILLKPYVYSPGYSAFNTMPPGWLWRAKSNKCQYDKLLVTEIESGLRNIEVQYAVYMEATEAIVDVTLIDLVGQIPTEFRGTVKAWNTKVNNAISCLFEEEAVCVSVGKAGLAGLRLPLSRRAIVVPCKSSLVVHADISCWNEMFATGTIMFPARSGGEDLQMISGTGGTIEVKVTWLKNDGSEGKQGWIAGGEGDTNRYQSCDSSSRLLKVPCLDDPFMIFLSSFGNGDTTNKEMGLHSTRDIKRSLLEVFSIRFINHENLDISSIYGTVYLDVGFVRFILYNRKLGDPLYIDSKGFVKLTAPRHGIDVNGRIELCLYLFDYKRPVSYKRVSWWRGAHFHPLAYDWVFSRKVGSDFGPVEVIFAVYRPGAEATLDVTLLDYVGDGPLEVYGHVKVKNDVVCDPRAVSWLFRSRDEPTYVSRRLSGGSIALPLLRHAVVVPLGSKMIVDACIQYDNTVFTCGVRRFNAMLSGTETKDIKGRHFKIEVKVSWKCSTHEEKLGYCW